MCRQQFACTERSNQLGCLDGHGLGVEAHPRSESWQTSPTACAANADSGPSRGAHRRTSAGDSGNSGCRSTVASTVTVGTKLDRSRTCALMAFPSRDSSVTDDTRAPGVVQLPGNPSIEGTSGERDPRPTAAHPSAPPDRPNRIANTQRHPPFVILAALFRRPPFLVSG